MLKLNNIECMFEFVQFNEKHESIFQQKYRNDPV